MIQKFKLTVTCCHMTVTCSICHFLSLVQTEQVSDADLGNSSADQSLSSTFWTASRSHQMVLHVNYKCYFYRKSLEKDGYKSYICWWRIYKKTSQVWKIYPTNGMNLLIKPRHPCVISLLWQYLPHFSLSCDISYFCSTISLLLGSIFDWIRDIIDILSFWITCCYPYIDNNVFVIVLYYNIYCSWSKTLILW